MPKSVRYTLAVAGGWAVDLGLAAGLTLIGTDTRIAAAAGLLCGGLVGYFLQRNWVFKSDKQKATSTLPKFAAAMAFTLTVRIAMLSASALIWIQPGRIGALTILAIAYGISFTIGYFINKYLVFKSGCSR